MFFFWKIESQLMVFDDYLMQAIILVCLYTLYTIDLNPRRIFLISLVQHPAPYPALPSLHRGWTQACSRPKSIGKLCIVNPGRCFPFNIIEFWGKSFKLKRDRKDPKKTTLGLKKLHWNNILKAFGWASTVGIRQFIKILHTNSLNQL